MNRWTRHLAGATVTVLAVALSTLLPARASCPPLDAVCLAGETAATGQQLMDDNTGGDAVDPVVDPVKPVIDDTLNGVDPTPPGGGDEPPGRVGRVGDATGSADGHGGRGRVTGGNARGAGRRPEAGRITGGTGQISGGLPPNGAPVGRVGPPNEPTFRERVGAALAGAARSLAVVLTLLALASAFVTIQNRLDRKEPRLALAPVESDMVSFG